METESEFKGPDRPRTVDELLAAARASIRRYTPVQAEAAVAEGAFLVDIRPAGHRARDGWVAGARVVPRAVAEWRLDPSSPHSDPVLARRDRPIILICDEGYQSSLVAATLVGFGVDAGDVIGGVQEWKRSGLPLGSRPGSA